MFVDYSQLQPLAVVNQLTGLWLKTQVTPLFGPLVLFSQTFPASGMTHGGKLYAPLMQGQPITGLGFSSLPSLPTVRAAQGDARNINVWERDPSKPQNLENALYHVVHPLLQTPISSEAEGGAMHPDDAKAGGNNLKLGWQLLGHFGHIDPKLPTIKARDSIAEGYESGLRRQSPQMGTIIKGIVDGDERVLLPTPNTMEHREIKTPEQIAELKKRSPGGYSNLRETVVNDLFPTPMAQEGTKAPSQQTSEVKGKNGQVWLSNVAKDLEPKMLPTPQVDDAKNTGHNQDRRPTLASEVWETERETDWGKFAPAIERWEAAIDREAPAPTKPDGKDGQHRLSAEFTEWMMGLPAGWVTDPELGLSRNEQLKLCGNGVVPQQAALALTRLLTGVNIDSAPKTGGGSLMFPTPTVSDIYTDNLASTQQKPGSMHSVTLAQAAKWVNKEEQK